MVTLRRRSESIDRSPLPLRTLAMSVLLCVGACGSTEEVPPATATEDGSGSTDMGSTGASTAEASTSSGPLDSSSSTDASADASSSGTELDCDAMLEPGSHPDLELELDGLTRTYDLFVPSSIDRGGRAPLVVNMHGWGSSKEQQAAFSQMSEDAERRGYAVAYLQGYEASFNAGSCCGGARADDIDDVGFAVAVVDDIDSRACIDRGRVYATGFSNGAFMAYRLACEAADTFAAVAPVAGLMGTDMADCVPGSPVSVVHFHGMKDFNVPYEGRPWLGVPGVPDVMAHWAAHNGCDADSEITLEMEDVTCETWPNCADGNEVTVCRVDDGGHCWPGNPECPYGDSTTTISANERMFDAFDLHTR